MTDKDKYCPRCKTGFSCHVEQIQLCQCTKVHLTAEEIKYIKQRYIDCLCAHCLTAMKADYRSHKHLDKGK